MNDVSNEDVVVGEGHTVQHVANKPTANPLLDAQSNLKEGRVHAVVLRVDGHDVAGVSGDSVCHAVGFMEVEGCPLKLACGRGGNEGGACFGCFFQCCGCEVLWGREIITVAGSDELGQLRTHRAVIGVFE